MAAPVRGDPRLGTAGTWVWRGKQGQVCGGSPASLALSGLEAAPWAREPAAAVAAQAEHPARATCPSSQEQHHFPPQQHPLLF